MARYISDQNKTVFITESGTYASVSGTGVWPGLVTANEITTELNVESIRYDGSTDRNVDVFVNGGEDHEGTATYYPQDFRFIAYALGSVVDTGIGPYVHTIKEADSDDTWLYTSGLFNPFASFSLEESQTANGTGANFVRTANGCMLNSFDLSVDEGGIAECSVNYIAQNVVFSSGASTTVTAATTEPFKWQDFALQIPAATPIVGLKSLSVSINNNLERRHYMNGSAVTEAPVPLNRDYEITATVDGESAQTKTLYDNYFRGGSLFNCAVVVNDTSAGAGSRDMTMTFSGCRMFPLNANSANEGSDEQEFTIIPKTCSVVVNDATAKYAPW